MALIEFLSEFGLLLLTVSLQCNKHLHERLRQRQWYIPFSTAFIAPLPTEKNNYSLCL